MLGVPGHILRGLEEYVTRKNHEVLTNPLPTDDALLIHQEKGTPRRRVRCMVDHDVTIPHWAYLVGPQHAVLPDDQQVWGVTKERIRELQRVRKQLLGEGAVRADAEYS